MENALKMIQDLELHRAAIAHDHAGGVTKEAPSPSVRSEVD